MAITRDVFSSRFGFILAAAGSAVGLGNIWGFPTQTAGNGGAAFVFMYMVLAFCLAFPAFMAEIIIGRHGQANAVTSLLNVANTNKQKRFAFLVGIVGVVGAGLILSFYAIVAGWMMAYTIEPISHIFFSSETTGWLTDFSLSRNLIFTFIFILLNIWIISKGVSNGIETWSKRLMPLMFILLIILILYVFTLEGAAQGLIAYISPDFSRVFEPSLVLSALGQAFFSLSLGSGVMIVYGSYIPKNTNIVSLGAQVTLIDVGIAFLAGLLIIPAMYVAQAQGVEIFSADGRLLAEDTLVFQVLPSLFNNMGDIGLLVASAFFALMSIAALTSSISMLEGPVSYVVERFNISRVKSALYLGAIIFTMSALIINNFDLLFGFIITLVTKYSQPLVGMCCCIFVGWIWQRNSLLNEIKQGFENAESSMFWKVWPIYTKIICPLAIGAVFLHSIL